MAGISHGRRRLAGYREAVYRLLIYSIGHRQLLAYVRYMGYAQLHLELPHLGGLLTARDFCITLCYA